MAGFRGAVAVMRLQDRAPSRTIEFAGTLVQMRWLRASQGALMLALVLQGDDLVSASVLLYGLQADGDAALLGRHALPSDFFASAAVVLPDSVLLVSEVRALLLAADADGLRVASDFAVATRAPAAYTEARTLIGACSNVVRTEAGDAFYAATSKGELLLFEHRAGQFVITPLEVAGGENQDKWVFAALRSCGPLVAAGENMDGALLAVDAAQRTAAVQRTLPNWAPIIDIDSCARKGGMVMAACGNPAVSGAVSLVRQGVMHAVAFQSDPSFRGCSGLWPLKRFKADRHHSFVAASFPASTALFSLQGGELEAVLGCGLETARPTVTIANSDTTSYWIQVCPDRVLAVKITKPDELNCPPPTLWRPDGLLVLSAVIIRNYVVLLDSSAPRVVILHVSFQLARSTAAFEEVASIPLAAPGSCVTGFPVRLEAAESELLLAVAAGPTVALQRVLITEGGVQIRDLTRLAVPGAPVNAMAFWGRGDQVYFALGDRAGRGRFFRLDGEALHPLLDHQIGNAPVRLAVVKGPEQDLCCTSRGVWYMAHVAGGGLRPQKFHPHVDCFAELRMAVPARQKTFVATKQDTMLVVEADLRPACWLSRLFAGEDLRRVAIDQDGLHAVATLSTPVPAYGQQNSIELLNMASLESVLRTKIPAHITSICALRRPGYYAVASTDSSGQGTVHVFLAGSCADRQTRRKGSLAEAKRLPSSFTFVAASSGFASGISAMCEAADGLLLLSCNTDLYLLRLRVDEPSIQILKSDPRRSPAYHLYPRQTKDGLVRVAVYDEDGVEVIQIDPAPESPEACVIKHLRGDCLPRMGGKVIWLDDERLLVTDKTGLVTVMNTEGVNYMELVEGIRIHDIPYSVCPDPESPGAGVLISTMLGAIYRLVAT